MISVAHEPLCTELVERSDKLVFETVIFIIARVWLIFAPIISKHYPTLLVLVGILSGAENTRRTCEWGAGSRTCSTGKVTRES
jgi:hypothetical protein